VQAGPDVTVAIVSWNTRELLRRCLSAFEPEAGSGRAEIWVVDNASGDGSAELVRDEFAWARLIEPGENLGFGRAVNLVAARTAAPWLVVANADVAPHAGALDALLEAGRADPQAGVVAPRLVLPDGSAQHSVFAFPTIGVTLAAQSGLAQLVRPLGEQLLLPGHFDPDRPRDVPWAVAAFLLVRRTAWDAVGGFDESLWMYAEDLDLGWRMQRAGWRARYEPRAVVDHESGASTTHAWGDARWERWQRASYAWMLRRMGVVRTRAVAAIAVAGSAVRWALLAAAARIAPGRYARRRDAARTWIELHRFGLAPRDRIRSST
jgi:GT2 family glycosyltransferase